jgi:hypothetical protein
MLLGLGHDKRLRERRPSDLFCIIGIDQQGVPEIDRGAGEARQDEDVSVASENYIRAYRWCRPPRIE